MAGITELHADNQALRNGSVESVFPSGLAPKLTTLYAAFDDWKNAMHSRKKIQDNMNLVAILIILIRERERGGLMKEGHRFWR